MWRVCGTKIGVAVCAIIVIGSIATWMSTARRNSDCMADNGREPSVIYARKVIVRPWLGQHHVYGIFVVPRDKNRYRATVIIRGLDNKFEVERGGEIVQDPDVVISEGYYPKLVYLPTRRLLWKLLMGQFWVIQDPCNWILEFVDHRDAAAGGEAAV